MKTKVVSEKSTKISRKPLTHIPKEDRCALADVAGMLADVEKGNLKELLRLSR